MANSPGLTERILVGLRRVSALASDTFVNVSTGWPGSGFGGDISPTQATQTEEGYFRTSTTGTQYNSGTISGEEPNPALTEREWARISNDMQRTDPFVSNAVNGLLQTVASASWTWKPANDSVEALFLADFFEDMWDRMRIPWEQQVLYLARYALTGFRYAERIEIVRRAIDGELRTMVDFFADCEPEAHNRWISLDGGRTLHAVEQNDNSSGALQAGINQEGEAVSRTPLPRTNAEDLLLLVHNFTGSNWGGDGGLLRPAYGAYKDKKDAENIRAVALARWSSATPLIISNVKLAKEAGYTHEQIRAAKQDALDQASRFQAGEQSAMVVEDFLTVSQFGGTFSPDGHNKTIEQCNNEILMALLQPFRGMGLGDSSGSRSLATQSAQAFNAWSINILDQIGNQINGEQRSGGGVVGRIIEANWPGTDPKNYPKIIHKGLKADEFNNLVGMLSSLNAAGFGATPQIMEEVLDRMGIKATPTTLQKLEDQAAARSTSPESVKKLEELDALGIQKPGPGRPPEGGVAEDPTQNRKPRVEG